MVMAGEIEEPFSLSFQADSLHSGSISFGRFEAESLSWERRSSFSHNRYLEEVEKYSKPGSVTEKKAYFEAHFRRKKLMSQSSPECQSGIDYQTSENDTSENMGYNEEFEHNIELQFDKSSANSEYDGDSEGECEREEMRTSYVEPLFEPAFNDDSVVQSVPEHVNLEKEHQIETESLPVIDAEPGKEVRENLNGETVDVDMTYKAIHLPTNSHTSTKDDIASLEHQQESSLKVGSKLGSKLIRDKPRSPVSVSGVRRNVLSELSKDAAKKPIRTEREGPGAKKTERQSSQTAAPTIHSVHRTSKAKDSKSSKVKVIHDNRSEKELKGKKVVERKPSVSEKAVPKARQAASRPKQVDNSTKPGIKQSSVAFNFKSDQRAERRKEFFMKLEEKNHAKEAEMNQIQPKKMEKTEAEIKQLRRSLNFRATPMPSFYHEGVQHDSDRNKAVSSNIKSSKSTPRFGTARRSPSNAKSRNDQASFNAERVNASDPHQDSVATNCSLASVSSETVATTHTPSTSRGHPPQDETNSKATSMKEREKENGVSLQKHRVSASSQVTKSDRSEGNRKVGAARSKNEMMRKGMKGVGIGSTSRMGPLAVGVSS
ncbi:protein WVD2-like 7 isoform X1 [Actinidia eriantha]|uniref:protein WVD2-like 7 isoform X1 n=1 Tax=Actinidia eriantha TaxID=165200 RepID=UPI002584FE4F|nr:protein WVD2-like 7 isoform X1 [Actinidia eriantha]XP_057482504.1 protein WVD2-like 7 isoform X1 [Actinidia eriantha]